MNRHFIRHYVEMVVAMVLGMVVLGLPAEAGLRAMGTSASALETDAPEVLLLGMAVIMTVPMVAWMRYRGHTWRPSMEMGPPRGAAGGGGMTAARGVADVRGAMPSGVAPRIVSSLDGS